MGSRDTACLLRCAPMKLRGCASLYQRDREHQCMLRIYANQTVRTSDTAVCQHALAVGSAEYQDGAGTEAAHSTRQLRYIPTLKRANACAHVYLAINRGRS